MTTAAYFLAGRLWRITKRMIAFSLITAVLAAPAVFFGLPAAARTNWARRNMEKAATRTVGSPVHIDSMKFSWKEGLKLADVSIDPAVHDGTTVSFRAESARIRPNALKILAGKPRAKIVLEGVEITADAPAQGAPAEPARIPKFGFKLESVKILNGTFTWKDAAYGQALRIDDLSLTASGKLKKRAGTITIASIQGRVDGKPLEGAGTLSVTREGASGSVWLSLEDSAARERLARALRPFNLTLRGVASPIH